MNENNYLGSSVKLWVYENEYSGTFEHQFLYLTFGKVLSFGYQQT